MTKEADLARTRALLTRIIQNETKTADGRLAWSKRLRKAVEKYLIAHRKVVQ